MLLLILVAFGIRTSWFQTWAAQTVASYLSSEWETEVSIDKVDIIFFDAVELEGIYVEDKIKDTLLYSDIIHIDIADWSLKESFVDISQAQISNAYINIKKYEGDSTLNFSHITDYFASDDKDTTKSSDFQVNVSAIALNNVNFIYQDQNKEELDHGMDFSNLDFRNLSGRFSEFGMQGGAISLNIENIALVERSGFVLTEFSTKLLFSEKIISLANLRLGFNNSYLVSDYFELKTPNGSEDFADFVHKVDFHANIRDSRVSLEDVAYFVPSIYGMITQVDLNNIEIDGPVYGMHLKNLDISLLHETVLKGDFIIPDMDHGEHAEFNEELALFTTSVRDIENLNLSPFLQDGKEYIELPSTMQAMDKIVMKDASLHGTLNDFIVNANVKSGLGNVYIEDGIAFNKMDNGIFHYAGIDRTSNKHLVVENLNLNALSGNPLLGSMSGYLRIDGEGFSQEDMDLNFNGNLSSLGLNDYTYGGIAIKSGNFKKNIFTGKIDIEDDNLALEYDGSVDLNGSMAFDFQVKIDSSHLAELNIKKDSSNLKKTDELDYRFVTKLDVNIHGTSINELYGTVQIDTINYNEKDKGIDFQIDYVKMEIVRHEDVDTFKISSPLIDVDLTGKFDLEDISLVLEHQFSYVIGNLVDEREMEILDTQNKNFDLLIKLKDINPILQFYDNDIYVAENSQINSRHETAGKIFALDMVFPKIVYHGSELIDFKVENHFDSTKATIHWEADYAKLNDSVQVRNLYIDSYIKNNVFLTNLGWDGYKGTEPALLAFQTLVDEEKNVLSEFSPSFFFLKTHRWDISSKSKLLWSPDLIQLTKFNITNKNHVIGLDGKISKDPNDWLTFFVQDFDLDDLNGILGGDIKLGGILNVNGGVADLYGKVKFMSLSEVSDFFINDELVGDLLVDSKWHKETNSVSINGNLKREGIETFGFNGEYFTEDENLDVDLIFDKTNIAFLNAFEDPTLYTNIAGILDGKLKVTGKPWNPNIGGRLTVVQSNVHVPMFNVDFGAEGDIKFGDGEFIVDYMKLYDQEGNEAMAQMQIYHYDWADWNFDITLNMDSPKLSEQFLVMDTEYKEGDYYYGKAYITGFVNIFGYGDLVEIAVDAKTQKGTNLTLPMYGSSDLEETSFIKFGQSPNEVRRNGDALTQELNDALSEEIEKLGMTLDMKFDITKDAQVQIIFDPLSGDQIVVNEGAGKIELKMDNYGTMSMFGRYVINDGVYNMRMGSLIKEDFIIMEGSDLSWTQSPYDADIDIVAYFERNVSMDNIMVEDRGDKKDIIYGDLIMSEKLMSPQLSFDIRAPHSDEAGKAAINGLKANPDDVNKQFFSLLVLYRFLPANGIGDAEGGMMYSLAENQLNAVLGNMGENYDLASEIDEGSFKIGGSKQLSDKLTITTNIGVVNSEDDEGTPASNIVGDVNVQYKLNEDGTFTMNFFNESNEGSDAEQGPFTQGVSLHYQESFNTAKEFRLLQGFLNIFRSDSNKVKINKKGKSDGNWEDLPPEEQLRIGPTPVYYGKLVGLRRKFIRLIK